MAKSREQLRLTTSNDLLYQDKFFELSGVNPSFHYYPVLSRSSENWTGATGYVQDLLASNISNICKIDGVEFYLCGPPQMMNSTIDLLKANNVDISDIAYDEFIALKEHQKEHFSKQ